LVQRESTAKFQEAGENCIMRSFMIYIFKGNEIKEDEIGYACSTYGTNEKHTQNLH
jgi:hypothetical protein